MADNEKQTIEQETEDLQTDAGSEVLKEAGEPAAGTEETEEAARESAEDGEEQKSRAEKKSAKKQAKQDKKSDEYKQKIEELEDRAKRQLAEFGLILKLCDLLLVYICLLV